MSKVYKIPRQIKAYREGETPELLEFDKLTYEPIDGDMVEVLFWNRFPDYDFIFGVPAKSSSKYKLEVAFFQFRDTRAKEVKAGFYFDIEEAEGIFEGFKKIIEVSKTHSKHLWDMKK